jgi:hypothetical protein
MNYNDVRGTLPATVKALSSQKDVTPYTGREVNEVIQASESRSAPNDEAKRRMRANLEDSQPTVDQSNQEESEYSSDEDEEPLII